MQPKLTEAQERLLSELHVRPWALGTRPRPQWQTLGALKEAGLVSLEVLNPDFLGWCVTPAGAALLKPARPVPFALDRFRETAWINSKSRWIVRCIKCRYEFDPRDRFFTRAEAERVMALKDIGVKFTSTPCGKCRR